VTEAAANDGSLGHAYDACVALIAVRAIGVRSHILLPRPSVLPLAAV